MHASKKSPIFSESTQGSLLNAKNLVKIYFLLGKYGTRKVLVQYTPTLPLVRTVFGSANKLSFD